MKMGYEAEFLTCLQSLIGEVERKIRRGHERLALNQAHSNVNTSTSACLFTLLDVHHVTKNRPLLFLQ